MPCDTPHHIKPDGYLTHVPVPCGKCPNCKRTRVNGWGFRLQQEDKVSLSSKFITLTYDTKHVPITSSGYRTLSKRDVQLFMKRLRKLNNKTTNVEHKIKYYFVGEYGSKNERPHYHAIIFNVSDNEHINTAWNLGTVHIGTVSPASISYTLKYIDKERIIPKHQFDDRLKEFSLMSKGLGKGYLTSKMVKYHHADLDRNYVQRPDGIKIPMPKYYRNKIFTDAQKKIQRKHIVKTIKLQATEKAKLIAATYNGKVDLETYQYNEKMGRYKSFYKNQTNRS